MDLGHKADNPVMATEAPSSPDAPETIYPSMCLSDDAAESFMKEQGDMEIGDECTVTMRLRLTTLKESQARYDSGKRVEFDCLSMDDIQPAEAEGKADKDPAAEADEEDEAETTGNPAMDHVMRKGMARK